MNYPDFPRPEPASPFPETARKVFEGVIFDVYQWQQPMFDGTTSTFEALKRADTVVVVPITPEGKILITHEEQPYKGSFISFPGGRREDGESIAETAARELQEETGYEFTSLEPWQAFQPYNKINWAIFILLAKGCTKTSQINLDAGERITIQEISFDELITLTDDPLFGEESITKEFLQARLDPEKMTQLRALFAP